MYLFGTASCGCVAVLCTATGQPVSRIDQSISTVLKPVTRLCRRGACCYGNTCCSVLLDAVGGLQRASAWFLLPIWSSLTCAASKTKMSLFLFWVCWTFYGFSTKEHCRESVRLTPGILWNKKEHSFFLLFLLLIRC